MNPSYNIQIKETQPGFISLTDAKKHLKIDFTYEDDIIQDLIPSSIQDAENYMGLNILQKDVEATMQRFPTTLKIDFAPLLGAAFTVTYFDTDNQEQTLPATAYSIKNSFGENPCFVLNSNVELPGLKDRLDAVKFSYSCGMDLENIAKPIRRAVFLKISELYEYRTDRAEIVSTRGNALLRPYKVW
ncbi:phage gp6-like head-tail connector protein [Galbibacter sp. BG1]|uniref:head-tail connector protein n=1 Tax=Galbibacter sp. BG1 TaxID=1170699 RepID=UPI0015B87955|nr:head-tail connector protein [Galbibacter sp. BG1]QLE02887.1 phage gp6-like head-tail connector protein [Galbibacter sp. BG1]